MRCKDGVRIIPFISGSKIKEKVKLLARRISRDYKGKDLLLVCTLKGSWIFAADLVRFLDLHSDIEFVWPSSYGLGRKSSGTIKLKCRIDFSVKNKDVLIVEDIVETGLTAKFLKDKFSALGARSVKICAFLSKRIKRTVKVHVDYTGFKVPDRFVVGYGLDCAEAYRYFSFLGYIEELQDHT